MNEKICVIGVGGTRVGNLWDQGLRDLFHESSTKALKDAGLERKDIDAIIVGNMSAPEFTDQNHVGALCSTVFGTTPPAWRVENSSASGGTALHQGFQAIKSGLYETVMVSGLEKMTDAPPSKTASIMAGAGDANNEMFHGVSFIGLNALFARRYMHTFKVKHEDVMRFSVNAHKNGEGNPLAMYRKSVSLEAALKQPMVCDPLNVMDCSPLSDGSASVILTTESKAKELGKEIISLEGTSIAMDTLDVQSRIQRELKAVKESTQKALKMSGTELKDMSLMEVHDSFSFMTPLILESMGLAKVGTGVELALNDDIALDGKHPISTMGGLKARGHPLGATGVYQALEAVTQLRGEAGKCQVRDAETALTQCVGGSGSSVTTNIFKRY